MAKFWNFVMGLMFIFIYHGSGQGLLVQSEERLPVANYQVSWEEEYPSSNEKADEKVVPVMTNEDEGKSLDYSNDDSYISDNDQLNEPLLLQLWDETPSVLPRKCGESYMVVEIQKNFISSNTVFLSNCLQQYMNINSTHVIFTLPYSAFIAVNETERQCGCNDMRILHFGSGLVYVLELPLVELAHNPSHQGRHLIAYCGFEGPKQADNAIGARLKFYGSAYDSIPYAGTLKNLGLNEHLEFEVVSDRDLPNIDIVPINCWLSPHAIVENALEDMPKTVFLKDGCPAHVDVSVVPTPKLQNGQDGRSRIGLTLGKIYGQDRKYLYVHCQYVRCSNASGAAAFAAGWLPPCPWHHACAYQIPLPFNDSQLETVSSDIVFVTVREQPQGIHIPSASNHDMAHRPCDCKNDLRQSGDFNTAMDGEIRISWPLLTLSCIGAFTIGMTLAAAICYVDRRRLIKSLNIYKTIVGKHRGDEFSLLARPKEFAQTYHQPDVLAYTPEFKRAHKVNLVEQPSGKKRERHMAGHDGYPPESPADSFHATPSVVVGGSTIIRNDHMWIAKHVVGDSVD